MQTGQALEQSKYSRILNNTSETYSLLLGHKSPLSADIIEHLQN